MSAAPYTRQNPFINEANMKPLSTDINLDAEESAISQYLAQKWTPISNLQALVHDIRVQACHGARALVSNSVSTSIVQMCRAREAALTTAAPGLEHDKPGLLFDAIGHFLRELMTLLFDHESVALSLDGPWDYSRRVSRLRLQLAQKYPDLVGARPLGWNTLENGYADFDGQAEYDESADCALFQGTRVESAGAAHFVARTALPYVIYDEKCQGRKACDVLVGALYAQFLGLQEFLNTQQLLGALSNWVEAQPRHILVELPVLPNNPHVRALAPLAAPPLGEAAFQEYQGRQREFSALSDAEKAQRQEAQKAHAAEALKKLMAEVKSEDNSYADRITLQKEQMSLLMRSVFGGTPKAVA